MWSAVMSHKLRHASGNWLNHFRSSGYSASKSWGELGAVMATLKGARVLLNHVMIHAATHVLPTPCALRIAILVWRLAKARNTSNCHASGSACRTSRTNAIGALAYLLIAVRNGLDELAMVFAQSSGIRSCWSLIRACVTLSTGC